MERNSADFNKKLNDITLGDLENNPNNNEVNVFNKKYIL